MQIVFVSHEGFFLLLYFTFTVTTAFFFPAFTVILAVPAFFAFTTPFAFTVATFLLLLVNFTLSEEVIGFSVALIL